MVITIIIFQGILFVALIFLLRHFMRGHVTGAVGHLQKMNEELMRQQSDLKQKIAVAEKEYTSKMAKIQQEVTSRQSQVREESNKTLDEARNHAMEEKERIIKEALATREQMRQEVMAQMEEKAIQYSHDVIAQFVSGAIQKQVHEILIDELIAGIDELKAEQVQIQTDQGKLVVAEILSAKQKQDIQKALKQKTSKEIKLEEQTDASLIGGAILRFDAFIIDGSLAHRLKEAAAHLKKETVRRYQGKT